MSTVLQLARATCFTLLLSGLGMLALAEECKPGEPCTKPCADCADCSKPAEKPKKKKKKKKGEELPPPIIEPTTEHAERSALEHARERVALVERIQKNILRLTTPGYLEAQKDLVAIGKPCVPFLIDALTVTEEPREGEAPAETFNLQAPGRGVRQRPLAEVAYEVLDNLIRNHSSYTGEVPAFNPQRWRDFWAANEASVQIGS